MSSSFSLGDTASAPLEPDRSMRRILVIGVAVVALSSTACGGSDAPRSAGTGTPTTEMMPNASSPNPIVPAACEELPQNTEAYSGPGSAELVHGRGQVPGTANIYGAGRDAPPSPGGGGGGRMPPVYVLPNGTSRVVTFPEVSGRVNPIMGEVDWNGPDGDHVDATDVQSLDGISGIVDRSNAMFLVGVFLTDEPASNPPPEALDFSDDAERFDVLSPAIGQVFFIGDGEGRSFVAPDDATRLFLGFADAFFWEGCPGWYGNNAGHANVTIAVSD